MNPLAYPISSFGVGPCPRKIGAMQEYLRDLERLRKQVERATKGGRK